MMKRFLILTLLIAGSLGAHAIDVPKVTTKKSGLLVGIQKGLFTGIEIGFERQWKQIKLVKPKTLAFSGTGEYLLGSNSVGFKAGPWVKMGRTDFTYGAYGVAASDFKTTKVGIAPAIGIKLLGFHGQVSYNFMPNSKDFEYNKLNLSLRYYISKSRKFKVKK